MHKAKNFSDFIINKNYLTLKRSRSSGPGGQHVNKVESRVEFSFHLPTADWIPEAVRRRMLVRYASRLDQDGTLRVSCQESRSAHRNEALCLEKLREMIGACWVAPKRRVKTKPTRSSQKKRVEGKRISGDKKRQRRKPQGED